MSGVAENLDTPNISVESLEEVTPSDLGLPKPQIPDPVDLPLELDDIFVTKTRGSNIPTVQIEDRSGSINISEPVHASGSTDSPLGERVPVSDVIPTTSESLVITSEPLIATSANLLGQGAGCKDSQLKSHTLPTTFRGRPITIGVESSEIDYPGETSEIFEGVKPQFTSPPLTCRLPYPSNLQSPGLSNFESPILPQTPAVAPLPIGPSLFSPETGLPILVPVTQPISVVVPPKKFSLSSPEVFSCELSPTLRIIHPPSETASEPQLVDETVSHSSPQKKLRCLPSGYPDITSILHDIDTKQRPPDELKGEQVNPDFDRICEELWPSPHDHAKQSLDTVEDCQEVIAALIRKL